jgi:hypothetical protein
MPALKRTWKGEINTNTDQSVVRKHMGDDGGTFGGERGVQESTLTRLRFLLATFSAETRIRQLVSPPQAAVKTVMRRRRENSYKTGEKGE